MDAYRDELDAARQRISSLEAELVDARGQVESLGTAVQSREDQIAALRERFDGAPSKTAATRLRRLTVAAMAVAAVASGVAYLFVDEARRDAAAADARAAEMYDRSPGAATTPTTRPRNGQANPESKLLLADPVATSELARNALRYQALGDLGRAEKLWRQALAENSLSAELHFRLAKLLLVSAKATRALSHLEKCVRLARDDGKAHGWLWRAYWFIGELTKGTNSQRALQAYRKFLDHATDNNAFRRDAERAIRELEAAPGSGAAD